MKIIRMFFCQSGVDKGVKTRKHLTVVKVPVDSQLLDVIYSSEGICWCDGALHVHSDTWFHADYS